MRYFAIVFIFMMGLVPGLAPGVKAGPESQLQGAKPASSSFEDRFNQGLVFYQQKKPALAKAFWRQALFQNPYNKQVRSALKQLGDKPPFWLLVPEDIALALITFTFFMLCLGVKNFLYSHANFQINSHTKSQTKVSIQNLVWLFFKQKIGFLCVCAFLFCVGAGYFYVRLSDWHTLAKPAEFLSAPLKTAPVLFKNKAPRGLNQGPIVKRLKTATSQGQKFSLIHLPNGQTGWVASSTLISVSTR